MIETILGDMIRSPYEFDRSPKTKEFPAQDCLAVPPSGQVFPVPLRAQRFRAFPPDLFQDPGRILRRNGRQAAERPGSPVIIVIQIHLLLPVWFYIPGLPAGSPPITAHWKNLPCLFPIIRYNLYKRFCTNKK